MSPPTSLKESPAANPAAPRSIGTFLLNTLKAISGTATAPRSPPHPTQRTAQAPAHEQLELFTGHRSRDDLLQTLTHIASIPIRLTLTRNRTSIIAVRVFRGQYATVRMHEEFLRAPNEIISSLGLYIRTTRRDHWRKVSTFARNLALPPTPTRSRNRPAPKPSRFHDLQAITREVNHSHFQNQIQCVAQWGRAPARRPRRRASIRFGSWNEQSRTITVHPLLDSPDVPESFVRYIVFHEMLHAASPIEKRNGKRSIHTPQFRTLENNYPAVDEMRRLSRKLLTALR